MPCGMFLFCISICLCIVEMMGGGHDDDDEDDSSGAFTLDTAGE